MPSWAYFQPPDLEMSNRLVSAEPQADQPQPAWGVLLVLLTLAALPRLAMAYRLDTICPDGMFYMDVAKLLESGQLAVPRGRYDFNVYPLVLSLLHQLGLGYELGAKLWGVACGSLVVLPMFGWVRRQYSQPMAVGACIFNANHPKLIEWSPEIVRESTFWLLFVTSIYLLWRGMAEVRLVFFALASVFITLAGTTRFEGWFLAVPICIWFGFRWQALTEAKGRLVLGMVLMVAMVPVTLMGLTLAHGYQQWQWGDLDRVRTACAVADSMVPGVVPNWMLPAPIEPSPEMAELAASGPAFVMPELPPPVVEMRSALDIPDRLWLLIHTFERGLTSIFGLMMIVGQIFGRQLWLRRDNLALLLMCFVVLAGVWIHLCFHQAVSSRYFTVLIILACPFIALGFTFTLQAIGLLAGRVFQAVESERLRQRILAVALASVSIFGIADALGNRFSGRRAIADLGDWVRQELEPNQSIVGSKRWQSLNYYAEDRIRRSRPKLAFHSNPKPFNW